MLGTTEAEPLLFMGRWSVTPELTNVLWPGDFLRPSRLPSSPSEEAVDRLNARRGSTAAGRANASPGRASATAGPIAKILPTNRSAAETEITSVNLISTSAVAVEGEENAS